MRVVNLGFFPLTPQHLEKLRELPGVKFSEPCETRTLLPVISGRCKAKEVWALTRVGVEMAGDLQPGDLVVFTGLPDICVYLDRLLPAGVRLVVPVTRSIRLGMVDILAMREVARIVTPGFGAGTA